MDLDVSDLDELEDWIEQTPPTVFTAPYWWLFSASRL
jgi:hypothetical protein